MIVVVGDGGVFPSAPGSPAAPTSSIYQALKRTSRMLGRFPLGHALVGQQRLVVLKVNENYSSQIPSCWSTGHGGNARPGFIPPPHPPLPDAVPPQEQRLHQVDNIWSVKQCPHCNSIWNRDVNACRCDYSISDSNNFIYNLEILVSSMKVFETIIEDLQYLDSLKRERL